MMLMETRIAYQDKLLLELNEVIVSQGRQLDELQRRLASVERLLREGTGEPLRDERPPHY